MPGASTHDGGRRSWGAGAQANLLTGKRSMAFQSNGPVMLALPPFLGFTRRIILVAAVIFVALWVLSAVWPVGAAYLLDALMLNPQALAHGMLWQAVTYPFIDVGLLSVLFGLLSV